MELKLTRVKKNVDCILGELKVINDEGYAVLHLKTLERPRVGIEANQRLAVPSGVYNLEKYFSNKFKKDLFCLFNEDVNKNRRIAIHAGNTSKDSDGCILVGLSTNDENCIFKSKEAMSILENYLKDEKCLKLVINEKY